MDSITELLNLTLRGFSLLTQKQSTLLSIIITAFILAGLSWYLCNNYVKLWNKQFRLTATHQTLTIAASLMTFFFVLAFGGLGYMKDVAQDIVKSWEAVEIKADLQWSNATFKDAYYKVKDLKVENFADSPSPENGGHVIPASQKISQETAAKVYALAACNHFDQQHPFLSKIIWSDPKNSAENISNDVVNYFGDHRGRTYSTEKAIAIAAETIKEQLNKQTPRTATLSRILLVILYLLVIAIPLGAIGYAAYKDISIRK